MTERLIIDKETGEIVGTLNSGDRIQKAKQLEYIKNTLENNQQFVKLFISNISVLCDMLKQGKDNISYSCLSLMFYLMQFISYKTGLLQHENGKPLTIDYILKHFQMGKNQIYNNIRKLKEKGIISIVLIEDQQYFMFNPFIASKGQRVDKTSVHIFSNTIYAIQDNKNEN